MKDFHYSAHFDLYLEKETPTSLLSWILTLSSSDIACNTFLLQSSFF